MKALSLRRRRASLAFTLVELLVVIGIIALLVSVSFPAFSSMIKRGQSIVCSQHLKSIGVAVMQCASDNNNTYPKIDQAGATIYPPTGSVPGLVGVLGPYGITTNEIQCPVDMGLGTLSSSFHTYGSSYEWNPIFDDGSTVGTAFYLTPTLIIPVNSTRVRLCMDFNGVHNNKHNALYGDGHVVAR